jgi:carbon-monoxide dehydrogenase small subunit
MNPLGGSEELPKFFLQLTVNGTAREVDAPALARLIDVLRGPMGLTGAKEGCNEGDCGECSVMLGSVLVNSCLVAAGQCVGREVVTVEGLKMGEVLAPLKRCLDDMSAECGCASGMMVAAESLLRVNPRPSEAEVREAIAGNRCRCIGGTQRIVEAIVACASILPAPEKRRSMFPPGVKA